MKKMIKAALAMAILCSASVYADTGLWVGTAAVDHVSEIHNSAPDLSFDLRLEAMTSATYLVAAGDSWAYSDAIDMAMAWVETDYDDTGWATATAPLGDAQTGATTLFARKLINVPAGADGWRRTQTLDRYLDLDLAPQNIRIAKVSNTAQFVIEALEQSHPHRLELERQLAQLIG